MREEVNCISGVGRLVGGPCIADMGNYAVDGAVLHMRQCKKKKNSLFILFVTIKTPMRLSE